MSIVLLAVVLALTALAAWGPAGRTFGILIGSTLLLPATVLVPGAPSGVLTSARLIEAGAVIGAYRAFRARPSRQDGLPLPPVLLILLVYLGVTAITGVGLAEPTTDPVAAAYAWVGQAEQAVLLVVAIVLARRIAARRMLVIVAGLTTIAVLIGLTEAATGASWAHFVFRAVPKQLSSNGALGLEHRAGHLRVRGAGDFALEYGWILAALVPFLAATAVAVGRRVRGFAVAWPVLCVVAVIGDVAVIYLTRSRSALAAAFVIVVVAFVVVAPRRALTYITGAIVAAGVAIAIGPSVVPALSPSLDQNSIDVRVQRLPAVLDLATGNPWKGVGLTGLSKLGLAGVDAAYVRTYVEAGIIAATLLVAAVLAAVVAVGRGPVVAAGRTRSDDALLAAAVAVALLVLGISAVTFDTFNVLGSARLFWLLGGAGIAATERLVPVVRPQRAQVFSVPRLAVVVSAAAVGMVAFLVAPRHVAERVVLATLDLRTEVEDLPTGMGDTLATTACDAAVNVAQVHQPWHVTSCVAQGPPGWAILRVQAKRERDVDAGVRRIAATIFAVPGEQGLRLSPSAGGPVSGRPTAATVAPVVLPLLALAGCVLFPVRRRRDPATPGDDVTGRARRSAPTR